MDTLITDALKISSLRDALQDYIEAFKDAEDAIKHCELDDLESGLSVVPVNELRYAGKHATNFAKQQLAFESSEYKGDTLASRELRDDYLIKMWKELYKATGHARRAQHDAYDLSIHFYLLRCIEFENAYAHAGIKVTFDGAPDYHTDKERLNAIKGKLIQIDREEPLFFEKKSQLRDEVATIYVRWNAYRAKNPVPTPPIGSIPACTMCDVENPMEASEDYGSTGKTRSIGTYVVVALLLVYIGALLWDKTILPLFAYLLALFSAAPSC